jgi:cbb3-type cytochrome oxidase subunit 3
MDWTWGWTAIGAIATAVATIFIIGGIIFAFRQISEARKSTNAQSALELFRELRNPETIEKLRLIYELTQDEFDNLPSEKSKEIDYVIDKYGALKIWVDTGIIDKKIAVEAGPSALRCWYRLHSYIKNVRDQRGYYGYNFEAFVRLALDHFRKRGIWVKLWQEGHQGEDVDLVTELQDERIRPRNLKEIEKDRKKGKV